MKTKLKARRLWANYYSDDHQPAFHKTRESARECVADGAAHVAVPVAVIPLDDVDALISNALSAFASEETHFESGDYQCLRAALAAIGVLPKQRKKKS